MNPRERVRIVTETARAVLDGRLEPASAVQALQLQEQQIAPHRPSHLLLWEAEEPDHVEDVSSSLDRKLEALLQHASQFESTMQFTDGADHEVARFRDRLAERAREAGRLAGFEAGEAFKLLSRL